MLSRCMVTELFCGYKTYADELTKLLPTNCLSVFNHCVGLTLKGFSLFPKKKTDVELTNNNVGEGVRDSLSSVSSPIFIEICNVLRDLVPFVQFKKREKTPIE